MAQLDPEASSLGTDGGSASEMAAVVIMVDVDMASQAVGSEVEQTDNE
jgi:hypothetical protein